VTATAQRPATSRRTIRLAAGLLGVVAAAVALGIAQLVAAAVGPNSSPVVAVGAAFIDLTPRPLKDLAIRTFGENDKNALLIGTGVLLVVFAVVIGLLTLRRRRYGVAGIVLFGVVGVLAALTRPTAEVADALPSMVGVIAGILALLLVARALPQPPAPVRGADAPTADDPDSAPPMTAPTGLNRRRFLLTSGASLAVAVAAGGAGRALFKRFDVSAARDALQLPAPASPAPPLPSGVDLRIRGLTPFTTPNGDFYRVDTALLLPQIEPDEWRLRIHGRVANPMTLTFDDLLGRDLIERDITIACVSNEIGGELAGHARWLGAPLKTLLDEVAPERGADQLVTRSSNGWTCGTPTAVCRDGRDAMLAVAMNGEPLPVAHGFPVRMIVPGLYGYVSATKWIVDLELTSFADFDPYWVRRGWAARAPIKTFSRIDTPRRSAKPGKGSTVTVAGVAWAQHRGIDRVEVRVDRGPWQTATLAPEANVESWRQWSWRWEVDEPGGHTLECRATDRTGATQPGERQPPFPDGATGWHSVVVTVE
jgi:DMSO/TMAO reductase YedYZ molybdopterin-dependent catalytic subunit